MISLDGTVAESNQTVTIILEGIGAAREPRAAAEEFRQLLAEQLEKKYTEVKVNFKNLEDLDTVVNLAGVPTASARFVLNVSLNPAPPAPGATPVHPLRRACPVKMKPTKLTKDQIQKISLSILGFIALIYCYFTFFLGPLDRSRADATARSPICRRRPPLPKPR